MTTNTASTGTEISSADLMRLKPSPSSTPLTGEQHTPKYVEEPGLIDEYVCSCGWKSGPFFDGAEFAYAKWQKHAKDAASLTSRNQQTEA